MNASARLRRRASSARRLGSLLACGAATALGACHEDVKLGGWHDAPVASLSSTAGTSAGNGGAAATLGTAATSVASLATNSTATNGGPGAGGGAGDTSAPPPLPACLTPATPGPINASTPTPAGAPPYLPTELATDWTWPESVPSMQWDLMVEREVVDTPVAFPEIGYYYNHQFSFQEEGIQGFLGIQAEGGYSAPNYMGDPWTKIAIFWLTAEDAMLGDIKSPNARIATDNPNGVLYRTIHARFAWQACRVYRFRLGPDPALTATEGRVWYGAWIEDVDAGVVTWIGSMLVPAGAGMLNTLSTSRTQSIDFADYMGCQYAQHASVLHGTPSSEDGLVRPTGKTEFRGLACPSSRFTELDGAIRHEIMSSSAL